MVDLSKSARAPLSERKQRTAAREKLEKLAALLSKAVAESARSAGMRAEAILSGATIRIALRRGEVVEFEIVVEPRLPGPSRSSFASTARFDLYYTTGKDGNGNPAALQAVREMIERARVVIARFEGTLTEEDLALVGDGTARIASSLQRRQEVMNVQDTESGTQSILRISFACNQVCPFCFVDISGRRAGLDEIERQLDAIAARGVPGDLTISGGEPASDPRLPRIIELARSKGFRSFTLQTNAVYFAKPGLAERLDGLGVREYFISFHAHRSPLYDQVTGSKGQFDRAVDGIRAILALPGAYPTFNIVITMSIYKELPAWVDFIDGLRVGTAAADRTSVFFSIMNGIGHLQAPAFAVDLAELQPYLIRAAAACRERGLRVQRLAGDCSPPACILGSPGELASIREFEQTDVQYFSARVPSSAYGRAKRNACRSCELNGRCRGVPAEYGQLFGLGALRPV